jgi:hypothetical protein
MQERGVSEEDAENSLRASAATPKEDPFISKAKRDAFDDLDKLTRDIYDLHGDGLKTNEIAAKLGIGNEEVSRRLAESAQAITEAGRKAADELNSSFQQREASPMYNLAEKTNDLIATIGKGLKEGKALEIGAKAGFEFGKQQHDFIDRQQKEVAKSLTELASTLPKEERAPFLDRTAKLVGEPVALRADGKNEQRLSRMYREAYRIAGRIREKADGLYKRFVVDQIRKTAQRIADSPLVDVEYKGRALRLIRNLDFARPRESTVASLEGTKAYVAGKEAMLEPHSVPQEVMSDLERLNRTPAMDLPTHILEYTLGDLQILEHLAGIR